MTEQLIPFLTASILLTLSPGPDIIYVLVQGMTNGKKHGIVTALGLVSGIIVHTCLLAFGLSVFIRQSELLFLGIRVFGAGYLFYLAFRVYKAEAAIAFSSGSGQGQPFFALFRQGFLMNVLNPKVAIFFLAFFPGFLWKPEGNLIFQFFFLGGVFMLQAFLIFSIVAVLAGKISRYLHKYSSIGLLFKWLQVVVFLGIGIFILL